MASIKSKLPFEQGTQVRLAAAVDVFPVDSIVYVCDYFWHVNALHVRVRVPDDSDLGSFDLLLPLTGIKAFA